VRIILVIVTAIILSNSLQAQQAIFVPAPNSPFAVGKRPWDMAVGDVNKDGKLDIITANMEDDNATVLLGNGRGDFKDAPGSPFAAGAKPQFAAIGDLNGDRNLDLAFSQHDGSYEVRIFFGEGNGKFNPALHSPLMTLNSTDPHTHGLILNDVNGDGHLDIVTAHAGFNKDKADNSVSVLLGNGKGAFRSVTGSPFSTGKMPAGIVMGDVNNDGISDFVTPNEGSKDISIFLGDGSGGFKAAADSPLALRANGNYAALGDINRDGNPDLAITHDDSDLMTIFLGNGRGDFKIASGSPFNLGYHAWNVVSADMNNDTKMDLVIRGPNNQLMVLRGDGNGIFKPAAGAPFTVGMNPLSLVIADVNSDAKLDILTANNGGNNVTVLLGKGQ